jgi:hypothetical protein
MTAGEKRPCPGPRLWFTPPPDQFERNRDLSRTIDDLMQQIRHTERLITVYRNADEVIVGTEDQIYSRRGLISRIVLTAAEIGDQIVNILECRLEAMREELEKLGADHHGEKR